MRKIVDIAVDDVIPSMREVLKGQGVPETATPGSATVRLTQEAVVAYRKLAHPVGIIMEISKHDFESIYTGEGKNETASPLESIYPVAEYLALFAVTVGESISNEITRLFDVDEFAMASMLDAAASVGVEMTADMMQLYFCRSLREQGRYGTATGVMRFSPGYCGWDISGQKKLFDILRPEELGIELADNFLMQPIKSVSGVLVAGQRKIFEFEDNFSFCTECDSHSCRERIRALRK